MHSMSLRARDVRSKPQDISLLLPNGDNEQDAVNDRCGERRKNFYRQLKGGSMFATTDR
jgi:hypothetical protein